jgi:hypothetical protein
MKKPPLWANSALPRRAHLQFHAGGGGDKRAVAQHVLLIAHVEDLHRTGQGGRQQAIAVAAHRLDVLLEEGLAVGKAAHDAAPMPPVILPFKSSAASIITIASDSQ